eukprot:m.116893 g.116893  ORF g.116893 m.116893 type:complete len:439 (+) comp12864_c2_seq1:711-2027(+)
MPNQLPRLQRQQRQQQQQQQYERSTIQHQRSLSSSTSSMNSFRRSFNHHSMHPNHRNTIATAYEGTETALHQQGQEREQLRSRRQFVMLQTPHQRKESDGAMDSPQLIQNENAQVNTQTLQQQHQQLGDHYNETQHLNHEYHNQQQQRMQQQQQLNMQQRHYKEMEEDDMDEHITIVAGGRRFFVRTSLFESHTETLLSRMFLCYREKCKRTDQGDYVIENNVSSEAFSAILQFYKTGEVKCPATISLDELKKTCAYFLIPFDHTSIKCDNLGTLLHELSNQGAKGQFEMFLSQYLLPSMAKFAEVGDRKCHVVVLSDEQTVEWDDEIPPKHGEQFSKVVHCTALSRFLMSYENRIIARALLKEKGLKKILIGIEGYPVFVQRKLKDQNGNTLEVEYFYDQRPFIKASWEKQESKSRHVDFELLRTNTSTSVLSTVVT